MEQQTVLGDLCYRYAANAPQQMRQ